MRFRIDGSHFGQFKRSGASPEQLAEWGYGADDIEKYKNLPTVEPGDTWRIRWWAANGEGPIAGYAICCPGCKQVHYWTTALNCKPCPHEGKSSCWMWTGSAEENRLTASPSLFAIRACGWHGWLSDGILRG